MPCKDRPRHAPAEGTQKSNFYAYSGNRIQVSMNYRELFEATKRFREDPIAYDTAWVEARKIDWQNLHDLPVEKMMKEVIGSKKLFKKSGFLNRWKCRLPCSIELANHIKNTFRQLTPFLRVLEGETLEDIVFDKTKSVGDEKLKNREIIRHIFDKTSDMGKNGYMPVPASKLLHMVNPKLFVMWDKNIGKRYVPKLDGHHYAYVFLPQMQREVNEAIDAYVKDTNLNRNAAIKQMESHCGRTLAKLVDECNYIKYTRPLQTRQI